MAIGYKENSWKVLRFIANKGDWSTDPDDPYLSCFSAIYSNVLILPIGFPRVFVGCFDAYIVI